MLLDLVLIVALVPCVAVGASWALWMSIIVVDWTVIRCRGIVYRRRLNKPSNLADWDELDLANRLWEIDWLFCHARQHHRWNPERLQSEFQTTREQLHLKQISREAHELWVREQNRPDSLYQPGKNLL